MKQLFFLLFFTSVFEVKAQSAKDSVIAAVNTFFKGMKNGDTAILQNSFSTTASLQTIENKNGVVNVKEEDIAAFISFVGKQKAGDADEQIIFETIKIDAGLASVWAPYKFYYKGTFSHCGVNVFTLVKINNEWKIQYIIDTRRKNDCP